MTNANVEKVFKDLVYYIVLYLCLCVTVDLLESYDNHPPIVLPSAGFKVDLESECVDDSIYRQLLYIRHFLWGLRTKTQGSTDRQDLQVCFLQGSRLWCLDKISQSF